MADNENNEPEDTNVKPRSNIGLIVGFVGVVVLVETGMFFFMVPSAEQVSALAEAQLIEAVQASEEDALKQASDEDRVVEFRLGQFGEVFSPINTEGKYRVEIEVYGLIRQKNLSLMEEEQENKNGRLRNAIRMKIRNSELSELEDNRLGLLQRRILTTVNHLLEEDYLLGIGFTSYEAVEE